MKPRLFRNILLASHGTDGARAAERLAYAFCGPRTRLHHLIVVPDFWKGMMGDDWLNNASTRDRYGRYVESLLGEEIRRHVNRMQREATRRRIRYAHEIVLGKPTECLIARAAQTRFDLIVVGAPRPKGAPGLRSRLYLDRLAPTLTAPLLVAPHPHG